MISVIIPLYNKEKSIRNTLQTVLNQTYQNFEIVIVNDGSTDKSVTVVESIKDHRIRLINQKNGGVSVARNRGISEAKGEYIAFLDADDEWHKDYLDTQSRLVEKYSECGVFVTNYDFKDVHEKVSNTIINKLPFVGHYGILSNYFEVASCSHPPLWTSAVMVRKTAIQSVGGFPKGIKSGEDLLTWAKLAISYSIAYTTDVKASFVQEGYEMKEKPKRIPAEIDIVGEELKKLADTHQRVVGLYHYVSHWHKMRSSCYMRLNMRKKSIYEACLGLKFNPVNYKLYIYIALNLLPSFLRPF